MPELMVLLGLALMALLPVTFFRRGRLNGRWWLTAAPFLATGGAIAFDLARGRSGSSAACDALAVIASSAAVGLILAARAAHASPVALWHQDRLPEDVVASGPYAVMRHPFYSAFLLLLVAGSLALPSPLTLASLAWGCVALAATAAAEERALLGSPLGDRYRDYVARTGRFVPRLRRRT